MKVDRGGVRRRGFTINVLWRFRVKRNAMDDNKKGRFAILVDGPVDLTGVQSLDDIDAKKIVVSAGRRFGMESETDSKYSSPSNEKPKIPRFQRVEKLVQTFPKKQNGKTEKTEKEEQSEADVSTPKARDGKESRAPTTPEKESITQKSPSLPPVTQPLLLPAISSNQKIEQSYYL